MRFFIILADGIRWNKIVHGITVPFICAFLSIQCAKQNTVLIRNIIEVFLIIIITIIIIIIVIIVIIIINNLYSAFSAGIQTPGGGGATPYPFIYHLSRKRSPFRLPFIDKWYSFHIPCLELCVPFNCCKCTIIYVIGNHKNRTFSRLYKAIKLICQPFLAL